MFSLFARQVSGLSQVIGRFFVSFRDFPAWLLALLLSALTAAFTEITSNVATATIFLPIVAELVGAAQLIGCQFLCLRLFRLAGRIMFLYRSVRPTVLSS